MHVSAIWALLGSMTVASTVKASSPTAMDLALSVRVLGTDVQTLTPGTTGLLEFTIDVRLAPVSSVGFSTVHTPVVRGASQPIRIFAPAGMAGACSVQPSLPYPAGGSADLFWYVPGPAIPTGGSFTCVAGFEILAQATRPMMLAFQAAAGPTGTSIIHFDLTPDDNFVYLPFGTPAAPVPATSPLSWLLLGLLAAWAGAHRLQGRPA